MLVCFENCKQFYHVLAYWLLINFHKISPWLCGCNLWLTFRRNVFQKLGLVQYNATLVITGTIKSSSIEKLYQKLGLEYLYKINEQEDYSIKFFFSVGQPSYILIYYRQWEVLVDMLILLIRFLADLNISRTLLFLMSLIIEWIGSRNSQFHLG